MRFSRRASSRAVVLCSLLAASVSNLAGAQPSGTASFILQASVNFGNTWTTDLALGNDPAGYDVTVRIRARLDNAAGVIGFGGSTYQPTLSNWNPATDVRLPFNGIPGPIYGRMFPFSSVGQTTSSASGLLTSFVDNGNTLRFAGAHNVTPTTNLAWGVVSSQLIQQLGGTDFVTALDPVIFRYVVHLVPGDAPRTLTADIPRAYIQNSGRTAWFTRADGAMSYLVPVSDILPATITLAAVPAPGTLALVGFGALGVRRRR